MILVDGIRAVADALASMIDAEPDIEIVARCASLAELKSLAAIDFDVCLTRFIFPDGNGADATRLVKQRWPHARVVVLSAVDDRQVMSRIERAGADAFVGRDETMTELIEVLRGRLDGRSSMGAISSAGGARTRPRRRGNDGTDRALTPREMDVLRALAQGRTSRQICIELGIGQNTLRTHVGKIIGKLQVNSRLEAVAVAQREHIV